MKQLLLTEEAQSEADEAFHWYDDRAVELGISFLDELDATMTRIATLPDSYRVVHRDLRRVMLRRFPYLVFFRMLEDKVLVVGVIHSHRAQLSWKDR